MEEKKYNSLKRKKDDDIPISRSLKQRKTNALDKKEYASTIKKLG